MYGTGASNKQPIVNTKYARYLKIFSAEREESPPPLGLNKKFCLKFQQGYPDRQTPGRSPEDIVVVTLRE